VVTVTENAASKFLWHENQRVNNANTEVINELAPYKLTTTVNKTFSGQQPHHIFEQHVN
jgi:hypothetical protein